MTVDIGALDLPMRLSMLVDTRTRHQAIQASFWPDLCLTAYPLTLAINQTEQQL